MIGPSELASGDADALLRRRHHELARHLAELQWDLGGLAYEMAIRDHFRLDLLLQQAAKLQTADAELAALEQMIRSGHSAAAGTCGKCSAPYTRGAVFCWQCGTQLMARAAIEPQTGKLAPPEPAANPAANA